MNKKHLLVGCSAGMVVAVVMLGAGAYLFYRAFRHRLEAINRVPAGFEQPRVLSGEGLMTRDVFSKDSRLAQVQAMAFGPMELGEPDELCSVSGFGALFIDADGATRRYIPYGMQQVKVLGMKLQAAGGRVSRFQIIDLGGTGECSYLARDNPVGSELIGHDGKSVWQLGGGFDIRSHPSDVVAGDLNGDGKTEFVAAYRESEKGLVLYDASLNEEWSKPDIRASHVELIDSDNDKKNIVCSDSDGINILDPQGNLVSKFESRFYGWEFQVLTWPPGSGIQYILGQHKGRLILYDLNGKAVFDCDVPSGEDLSRIRGAGFMAGKVPYLAIVGSTFTNKRSIFCVYGLPEHRLKSGTLVESPLYQEVLADSYESITRLPADESGRESILIGGPGQILRYKPGSLPRDNSKRPRSAPSPYPAKKLKAKD
jgi:hypothetical protein